MITNDNLRHAIATTTPRGYLDSTVFGSWSEFTQQLDTHGIARQWGSFPSSQSSASEWNGNVSYLEARELAEHGWPEGVRLIQQVSDEVAPYALRPQQRPQWEYTHAGFLPSMAAYVAGAPEHMLIRTQADDPTRPVVRIVCSVTASAHIPADVLVRRGAAVLSVLDYLESSGTRVELTLFDGGHERTKQNSHVRYESLIVLKRPDEHVDIDRLAFALVHPAMLRKLLFKLREACPELRTAGAFGSYGSICEYKPESDEVYLPSLRSTDGFETPAEALKTVIQIATKALGAATFEQA